jgi:hypothetical protein
MQLAHWAGGITDNAMRENATGFLIDISVLFAIADTVASLTGTFRDGAPYCQIRQGVSLSPR